MYMKLARQVAQTKSRVSTNDIHARPKSDTAAALCNHLISTCQKWGLIADQSRDSLSVCTTTKDTVERSELEVEDNNSADEDSESLYGDDQLIPSADTNTVNLPEKTVKLVQD